MVGRQLASFWEGNRAELLATHVLSSVAAVSPVPHQFDFGFDLLCTLTRSEERFLFAGRSFGVQVKTASAQRLEYGGLDAHGNQKSHEVDWLYGQDQPLFICVADVEKWAVAIYSVFRIWWLRWQVGEPGSMVLVPDLDIEEFEGRSMTNRYRSEGLYPGDGDVVDGTRRRYFVPLGPPIVTVDARAAEPEAWRDSVRASLSAWIELEYRNIQQQRARVPFVEEKETWNPNEVPPAASKIWHLFNSGPDRNVPELLHAIGRGLGNLLLNLRAQGQTAKVAAVLGAVQLADAYGAIDPIARQTMQEALRELEATFRGTPGTTEHD